MGFEIAIALLISGPVIWLLFNISSGGGTEMDSLAADVTDEILALYQQQGDRNNLYIEGSTRIMYSFEMNYDRNRLGQYAKFAAIVRGKLIARGMPKSVANAIQNQFKSTINFRVKGGRL